MLKYIKKKITPTDGEESLVNILAGMAGKNRVVVSLYTAPLNKMYIRVYRDAEQIVDANSLICTSGSPLLPMNVSLADGQQLEVGFYNDGGDPAPTDDKYITIGYTEAD